MIYLSPTALQDFFYKGCPACWGYSRNWELIAVEPAPFRARGSLVHALLEGKIRPKDADDSLASALYAKLLGLRRNLGLKTIKIDGKPQKEIYQRFEITPGVMWTRKLDDISLMRGQRVIVDYKTVGTAWKAVNGRTPKAAAFQGPGYTWPPPGEKNWPRTVLFLVAPYRGPGGHFTYERTPASAKNMLLAIQHVKQSIEAGLPRCDGAACEVCDFRALCWKQRGWQKLYRKRQHG